MRRVSECVVSHYVYTDKKFWSLSRFPIVCLSVINSPNNHQTLHVRVFVFPGWEGVLIGWVWIAGGRWGPQMVWGERAPRGPAEGGRRREGARCTHSLWNEGGDNGISSTLTLSASCYQSLMMSMQKVCLSVCTVRPNVAHAPSCHVAVSFLYSFSFFLFTIHQPW